MKRSCCCKDGTALCARMTSPRIGVYQASISRAMRILRENGYILIAHSGQITLTEAGMDKACDIYERHCVITQFLMQTLQLDMDAADADACRIEHVVSEETL